MVIKAARAASARLILQYPTPRPRHKHPLRSRRLPGRRRPVRFPSCSDRSPSRPPRVQGSCLARSQSRPRQRSHDQYLASRRSQLRPVAMLAGANDRGGQMPKPSRVAREPSRARYRDSGQVCSRGQPLSAVPRRKNFFGHARPMESGPFPATAGDTDYLPPIRCRLAEITGRGPCPRPVPS